MLCTTHAGVVGFYVKHARKITIMNDISVMINGCKNSQILIETGQKHLFLDVLREV